MTSASIVKKLNLDKVFDYRVMTYTLNVSDSKESKVSTCWEKRGGIRNSSNIKFKG